VALVGVLVLALAGWLMISRRLAATLALPLAALALAVVGLLPQAVHDGALPAVTALIEQVVEPGIVRLQGAIFAVILGAALAAQMRVTGAAERLIRYATEYAGENRLVLALSLLLVIALLFTSLGGLGAVILVATVVLPLMFSLGFEPRVAGVLFLFGLSLGGCLNPVNWQLYKDVLQLPTERIIPFAMALAALFFLVCCAYIAFQLAGRLLRQAILLLVGLMALCALTALAVLRYPGIWTVAKHALAGALLLLLSALLALVLLRLILLAVPARHNAKGWLRDPGNSLTGASVLVPLALLLWSSLQGSLPGAGKPIAMPILTALLAGIVYCAAASYARDGASANRFMRALHEALTSAGPAVMLLIGIGLLLQATVLPSVAGSYSKLLAKLPLGHPAAFVLVFFILSPLALYRGPLNLWGMGSGVVGVLSQSAVLRPELIMAAFFSVGMLQGVCDPTNTHNVWIANFCRVPVGELTRDSFLWVLTVVLLGLVAGALMFPLPTL
jgi:hypothetical protein